MSHPTFKIFLFQLEVLVRLVVSHPDVATPPLVKSVKSRGVRTDNLKQQRSHRLHWVMLGTALNIIPMTDTDGDL